MTANHETSFEKGLRVLRAVSRARDGMRVSELSKALDYPESTVVRLLNSLKKFDYVAQDRSRGPYTVSYGVLELAGHMLDGMELRQVARPFLHDLASRTTMAAYLKVPSGDSVVTVDAAIPPRAWLPNFEIGRRFPMHRSSMGKAMLAARGEAAVTAHVDALKSAGNEDVVLEDEEAFLAEMAQARERGYAVNQVPGSSQHSIGAPIRRFDSQVVGAVGVGFRADAGVLGSPREHEVSHEVLTTARSISFAIGYQADRLI